MMSDAYIGTGIIKSLCELLNTAYQCDVWAEESKQGFKEPCFFVQLIRSAVRRLVGKRYVCENMFCIQYFPAREASRLECAEMESELYLSLEYITVDGKTLRGTKMSSEYTDGFLSFFFSYNLVTVKMLSEGEDDGEVLMDELDIKMED